MNDAIKLAIEKGGYKYLDLPLLRVEPTTNALICLVWRGDQFSKNGEEKDLVHPAVITTDPLFWQALGKALGWEQYLESGGRNKYGDDEFDLSWKVYAHKYLDTVLTGGDTEQFWKELLNK